VLKIRGYSYFVYHYIDIEGVIHVDNTWIDS